MESNKDLDPEKKEAPKKPRRNLDALGSDNSKNKTTKVELYDNSKNTDFLNEKIEEKIEAPKKPRRNLDALEVSEKTNTKVDLEIKSDRPKRNLSNLDVIDKSFKKQEDIIKSEKPKRDLSGLDEELSSISFEKKNNEKKNESNKPKRDLSKLEENIIETKIDDERRNEKRNEKKNRINMYKNTNQNFSYDNTEEKKKEELRLKIDVNNTELFPTLGSNTPVKTPLSNANSKWNIKSELVSSPIPQTPKTPNQSNSSFKVSKNYKKNISSDSLYSPKMEGETVVEVLYDSDDNIIEENEISYDNESDENYNDEDSYDLYARELYKKRELLLDMIEIIEETYNPSKKDHVEYLTNLQINLANIEDKIDKHQHLENELEKIYGPSYIKYKSLYDLAVEKNEAEEEYKKSNDPANIKKFMDHLKKP
jgi:hypothetical protein